MRAQIPKNIRKYEDKVILGMNRRQSLFLLIAALVGIGLYLALRTVLSISFLLPLISMLVGADHFGRQHQNFRSVPGGNFLPDLPGYAGTTMACVYIKLKIGGRTMIFSKKRQGKGITFVGQENSKKKPREKKRVRNTAQKTIPFLELYDNGMFLVERVKGKEKYSLCFSMSNTDYALLKDEEKQRRLDVYQSVMNSLSPDIHYQELYLNRPLDMEKIGETLAPREMHPATEYQAAWLKNQQLFVRQIEGNISDTVLYYALSYVKRSKLDNPFAILMQAQQRIAERFEEIGVRSELLQPREVLELIYTIYNPFEEGGFILPADMYDRKTKIRDYIAPSAFKFVPKYTALGSAFNRVLFVTRLCGDPGRRVYLIPSG